MPEAGGSRTIETERLLLRPHRPEDHAAATTLWADPIVTRYTSGRPQSAEESWSRLMRYAGHWAMLGFGYWAVVEQKTGRYVGDVGLSSFLRDLPDRLNFNTAPEAGWVLSPAVHGKGYATEAVRAALAWGEANLGVKRFVCLIHPENLASLRVAEKTGFTPYARTRYKDAPAVLLERIVLPD